MGQPGYEFVHCGNFQQRPTVYRPWVWEERSKGKECEDAGTELKKDYSILKLFPYKRRFYFRGIYIDLPKFRNSARNTKMQIVCP